MRKYYSFAGIELELNIPDEFAYTNERHLAPFAVEHVESPHRFRFDVVDELTPPTGTCIANEGGFRVYADGTDMIRYIGSVQQSWEPAYLRVHHHGYDHQVQMKRSQYTDRIGVHTVLNCLSAEHLVARAGGFIFHSSYIERNGQGILFTAPSGTGKSTQADLWAQLRGARILNGDRSAIRVTASGVQVCGVPFAGSSQFCENVTLPLSAIVYLKQAPQTTIRRLRGAEAFRRVWEGCSVNTWDRADMELVSETVQKVLMTVPVFELACTPDESAILALEGVLE
ncbi:MAG: hypothetical protein IJZ52_00895 [Clostridium sp.]|nr:hypothetical protein [Clostridium sp.]